MGLPAACWKRSDLVAIVRFSLHRGADQQVAVLVGGVWDRLKPAALLVAVFTVVISHFGMSSTHTPL
jgi:hypothetical protein